jgi:hypothetical protein
MNIQNNTLATRTLWLICSQLLIGLLGACSTSSISSLSDIGSNEVIIVGRVELVPGLRKDEEQGRGVARAGVIVFGGPTNFENTMFLITGDTNKEIKKETSLSELSGRIDAVLDDNFYARSPNKPFYILGGKVFLSVDKSTSNTLYFPGGFKVIPKPDDKAVYIGTIRYEHDEFYNIKKVTIVDDYENTRTAFNKKFGNQDLLRKSLIVQTKQ